MKLIRPFDYNTDVMAIIEDDYWKFEVVVEPAYDENQKAYEIIYLDIPLLDENAQRTGTVVVNENYLLKYALAVKDLDHPLLGITDRANEEWTFGPEEGTAHTVTEIKRRAVSIVLEEIIDYVEDFVFKQSVEE